MIVKSPKKNILPACIFGILFFALFLSTIDDAGSQVNAEPYTGKPGTIAHDFLNMEKVFGANRAHHDYINSLINKAKSKITVKSNYSTVEAIQTLNVIYSLIKSEGFIFKPNLLMSRGINRKVFDCDNFCTIYTAIAEALRIPIIPVYAPNHSFVRFNFKDGSYLNWETTEGRHYSNAFYIRRLKISKQSIDKGVYLKSLSRKEFLGVEYNNLGAYLMKKKKYRKAIPYFHMSIRLYPNFSSAYHNRGTSFYAIKRLQKSLADLLSANTLDPLRASTHNTLGDIYFDRKEYTKAVGHYNESIRLNPKNYVPYYSIGLIMKLTGKTEQARKWLMKSKEIKNKNSH